ncbi:hypothetical protein EYF80_024293 [Liparis tanakae]|uniref:Uncharacterized protein n=1 Tax=Liparis tanakae TaxID=230148 RepID=A0A4Z2HKM4_9TELE|nr:hypothetical protein EYF80_024293 [Liparis tanakae]
MAWEKVQLSCILNTTMGTTKKSTVPDRKSEMFLSMASMYLPTLLSTTMLSGMPNTAKNTQKIWAAVELGLMLPTRRLMSFEPRSPSNFQKITPPIST